MISKKKEPSRKVSLISITDLVDTINELIQNANTAITKNNRLVDNFTNERNQLVKHIWNYFAHYYSAANEVPPTTFILSLSSTKNANYTAILEQYQ